MMNWNTIWGQAITPFPPLLLFLMPPTRSTIRFSVVSPMSGDKLRLGFSNIFGKEPYIIGECTVKSGGARVQITKDGNRQIVVPCGGRIYSDEIALDVASGESIEISMYFSNRLREGNAIEEHTNLVKGKNLTQSDFYPPLKRTNFQQKYNFHSFIPSLDSIEVNTSHDPAVIVAFGDSITQQSTWTKPLTAKLFERYKDRAVLINKGISGNRIRYDGRGLLGRIFGEAAKDRLDRDVLSIPNVKTVIFALGTNDIGHSKKNRKEYATASQISTAIQELVEKMNARRIKVIGTTLTPRMGSMAYEDYHEVTRKELNAWIRSYDGFDHVVSFDEVTRNPDKPDQMIKAYHCGDHLHPSKEGGKAMAEAFDLDKVF